MTAGEIIGEGVYLVGGPNISHAEDATSFVVQMGSELAMIDCGAGRSAGRIEENIVSLGLDPQKLSTLVLTHCHIDHVGGAAVFRARYGCRVIAHELDAPALEAGDPVRTAASWYGVRLLPLTIDHLLRGEEEILAIGGDELHCIHTPGHTPGSICLYLDRGGKRVLFGQDIHGPFLPAFGSDIAAWRRSMEKLLTLDADILCEGHFGIFTGKEQAERYIRRYLAMTVEDL
ncbi:MAG: MBL fold metallo-hydrolase [Smithellaceae bacterium]|nr:MBL fold metallo-hydrolase [Smithellaceae bacterium]